MHRLLIATMVSLFALNGVAFAAANATTSTSGDFQVKADTIRVDKKKEMHASGHVVITVGNTTIKMKRATISMHGGKTLVRAGCGMKKQG